MKKLAILALSAVWAMGSVAVSYAADSTSEMSSTTMMKADKHPGTMMKKEKKPAAGMAMKKKEEVKNPM